MRGCGLIDLRTATRISERSALAVRKEHLRCHPSYPRGRERVQEKVTSHNIDYIYVSDHWFLLSYLLRLCVVIF